jgi:RNA polymerase sporulation-specific sigma factor
MDGEPTLEEVIPGPTVHDPVNQVISSEELQALVSCLSSVLSELESRVLSL